MEERNEEIRSFVSFALLERLLSYKTIHILQLISSKQLKLLFNSFKTHCHKHTVPQTQTNSVSLYLHYFSVRLEENRQNTTICISDYEFSSQILPASSTIICNDFINNTLFNLALWFKLYFSFRESYDLILI